MNENSAKLLQSGLIYPIGWSADQRWVYAYDEQGIVRISVQMAQSERMPQVTGWEKAEQIDMSRDEKNFVMNFFEQQSDVWVVENFDPETAVQP